MKGYKVGKDAIIIKQTDQLGFSKTFWILSAVSFSYFLSQSILLFI